MTACGARRDVFLNTFSVGRGFKGELAILRGVGALETALGELHDAPYELLSTWLNLALARGLAAHGRPADANALLDRTIDAVREKGDHCYLPELLRVKGRLLFNTLEANPEAAEQRFEQSLALSRGQGARAWELRTAYDLAEPWASRGRTATARALLAPIAASFVEGPGDNSGNEPAGKSRVKRT